MNEKNDNKGKGHIFRHKLEHWQVISILLMIYDIIAIHAAYFIALWGRFDFVYSEIQENFLYNYLHFITPYAIGCIVVFWFFKLYRSMWIYASYTELTRTIAACFITSVFHTILITVCYGRMPITYYLWGMLLQMGFILGSRFSYRLFIYQRESHRKLSASGKRVMLIGAGAAGQMILRDIQTNKKMDEQIVCVIDDNSNKWNRELSGVPIVGGRDDILSNVEKYKIDKIYFAIPSAPMQEKRDILQICNETGCELKQLPGMYQFALGQVFVSDMKEVSVEDLLGREVIRSDLSEVYEYINGKTVLVTGGGGSIGSELCRQIAMHEPRQLLIFDIYENSAYDLQLELEGKYPELDIKVLIGSVRDSRRIEQVFETYKPEIVYHAAAHKHVPLMEVSPNEAIKNNVIGTYKTAYAAMLHGCARFVLISTDKAVNPTNIMGASKRLCEMIIQGFDTMIRQGRAAEIPQLFTHRRTLSEDIGIKGDEFPEVKTEFVSVRFGNVLGSNGSVIPIFKRQIEKGGPVTVTHPDIIRYFMTIPEAVSLVMLAGTYAKGGEIFVLDMGSPVKIDTLARNMIRMSGYKPDVDIKIEYTGLRPGEKLYEEKLMAEEGLRKTENEMIHIGAPLPFDTEQFFTDLRDLMEASYLNSEDICQMVKKVVPTYQPGE